MGTVNFAGSVSAQAQPGETVTLLVTKPDLTVDTLATTTLADGTFALTQAFTQAPAGQYSVVAHVDADSQYTSADSAPVAFQIGLTPRTITVNATVT